VAYFDSWLVEAIIIVFMLAGGLNFAYYDACARLGPRKALRMALDSSEVRAYLGLILCSTALITVALWFWGGSNGAAGELPDYRSFLLCLRDASFNVVNLNATCGFTTADFDRWPDSCRALLMVLVMIGPCAGSTGAGLKMIRALIVFKAALRGIRRFARPRAIHPLRVDGQTLDESIVAAVTGFFAMTMIVTVASSLAISAMGVDIVTAATSVIATLNNAGPGLALVGPAQNFGGLPLLAKFLLSLLMILGRLEFYALVALVIPSFWRK
jgi:trk system potassium uptake protein TrkH